MVLRASTREGVSFGSLEIWIEFRNQHTHRHHPWEPLVGLMSSTALISPYHERLRCGFRASSATDSLTVFPLSCLSPPHQLHSCRVRPRVSESTSLPRKNPKSKSVPPSLFQRKGASWAKSAECISTAAEWCVAHPLVVIGRVRPRVGC
jgi:hypothetical protein